MLSESTISRTLQPLSTMKLRSKCDGGRSTVHRVADLGSRRRRRHHRRQHIFDTRAGDAGDQSGTTLKGDVIPTPINDDRQTVTRTDQEIDVREAPKEPCTYARQLARPDLCNRMLSSDRGHSAEVAIAKRRQHLALGARD